MRKIFDAINHAIKAMGMVFGDIGTSPIYTLAVVFLTTPITHTNVLSILSLIVWTLLLVVTVQYAWFAMSLSKRGEGGTIVLNEVLKKNLKNSRAAIFFSYLAYIAISLLIGDSVITPAISVLSAVEGITLIEKFSAIPRYAIVLSAVIITTLLFSFQKRGTERVSRVFGPVMLIWFLVLFVSGISALVKMPSIALAINPLLGLKFLFSNNFAGFFILSQIILCATGAEALYADMGHMGRKPIVCAWGFVFFALIFSYLGQGVFILQNPEAKNILFSMILSQAKFIYIPFLILSIFATVIASQSMISGLFSIIYQAINTKILPYFKINFTSEKIKSQIYIGAINWFLFICVFIVILTFKRSANLAGAYGFAVSGAIFITSIMISAVFIFQKKYYLFLLTLCLILIDACFFIAACTKIPQGAYWSILIAMIPFFMIILYTKGQSRLYKAMSPHMKREVFLKKYCAILPTVCKIPGSAVFFITRFDIVPRYIPNTMFENNIIYSDNVFVLVHKTNEPHGVNLHIKEIMEGLRLLKINTGYMEILNLEQIFKELRINEKVVFYGVAEIESNNFFWNIFAKINKVLPSSTDFYKLPLHKIHGVATQVLMD